MSEMKTAPKPRSEKQKAAILEKMAKKIGELQALAGQLVPCPQPCAAPAANGAAHKEQAACAE